MHCEQLLIKIFKCVMDEYEPVIYSFCLKNSAAHNETPSYIFHLNEIYCPKEWDKRVYKALPLHKTLSKEFNKEVLHFKKVHEYEQSLVRSYISTCLSKHSDLEISKSYLIDCLKEGRSYSVPVDVKERIERNHKDAIQIIKKYLATSLLT